MLPVFAVPAVLGLLTPIVQTAPVSAIPKLFPRDYTPKEAISPNFPDPSLINEDNTWYAFATRTIGSNIRVPFAASTDYESWYMGYDSSGNQMDAMPDIPPWANQSSPNVWGPDVNRLDNGTYVMYFSATTNQDSSKHCVGAAYSSVVTGPYTHMSTPLYCPLSQGGAIDPAGFRDPATGTRYVVYKIDGDSLGTAPGPCPNTQAPYVPTPLLLQEVAADGVTPVGDAVELLDNNGASDAGNIEAPALAHAADGSYALFFSAGCFRSDAYSVSYATAPAVGGPYTRRGVLLGTEQGLEAPGGAGVDGDARHMVFHAGAWGSRGMYTALVDLVDGGVTVSNA